MSRNLYLDVTVLTATSLLDLIGNFFQAYFKTRFENLFRSIRYLGPLREYPLFDITRGEASIHEGVPDRHGEDMVTALFSGRDSSCGLLIDQIRRMVTAVRFNRLLSPQSYLWFGNGDYEFLVRKVQRSGPEVRLTDVGFGVSQVLPVLVLCYYVPEGSILILEQPEAHLHPKVQSELADLLIEVVKNRQLQIILESHSEHLLIRLMRRIAEEANFCRRHCLLFLRNERGRI